MLSFRAFDTYLWFVWFVSLVVNRMWLRFANYLHWLLIDKFDFGFGAEETLEFDFMEAKLSPKPFLSLEGFFDGFCGDNDDDTGSLFVIEIIIINNDVCENDDVDLLQPLSRTFRARSSSCPTDQMPRDDPNSQIGNNEGNMENGMSNNEDTTPLLFQLDGRYSLGRFQIDWPQNRVLSSGFL